MIMIMMIGVIVIIMPQCGEFFIEEEGKMKLQDLCVELMDKHLIKEEKAPFKIPNQPDGIKFDFRSATVLAGLNEFQGMKIGTPCKPEGTPYFYRIDLPRKKDIFGNGRKKYIVVSFVRLVGKYIANKTYREQTFYALADIGYDEYDTITDYLENNTELTERMRKELENIKLLTDDHGKIYLFTPYQIRPAGKNL